VSADNDSGPVPGEAIIREYVLACGARDLPRVALARHALFSHVRDVELELAQAVRDPSPALRAARQLVKAASVWYAIAGVDVPMPPTPRTDPNAT
jgi:hypothetical protein